MTGGVGPPAGRRADGRWARGAWAGPVRAGSHACRKRSGQGRLSPAFPRVHRGGTEEARTMWTQGVGMNGGAPVPEQRSVSGGVPEQPPGPDSERIAPVDGTGTADASGARSPGSAMRYAV